MPKAALGNAYREDPIKRKESLTNRCIGVRKGSFELSFRTGAHVKYIIWNSDWTLVDEAAFDGMLSRNLEQYDDSDKQGTQQDTKAKRGRKKVILGYRQDVSTRQRMYKSRSEGLESRFTTLCDLCGVHGILQIHFYDDMIKTTNIQTDIVVFCNAFASRNR